MAQTRFDLVRSRAHAAHQKLYIVYSRISTLAKKKKFSDNEHLWCGVFFFSLFLFVCLLSSSFRIYMYLEYKREREKEKEKWMLTVALKSFLINRFKNGNDHKNVYLPSSHREKKKKGTRDFRGLTDFFFFFLIWRICNFFFYLFWMLTN